MYISSQINIKKPVLRSSLSASINWLYATWWQRWDVRPPPRQLLKARKRYQKTHTLYVHSKRAKMATTGTQGTHNEKMGTQTMNDESTNKDTSFSKLSMAEQQRLLDTFCLLYTSPSPRDRQKSRMPSSA